MKELKNNNGYLITCISCIALVLALCYFGITNFVNDTYAASNCSCDQGNLSGSNCIVENSPTRLSGWTCVNNQLGVGYYCTKAATCTSLLVQHHLPVQQIIIGKKGVMDVILVLPVHQVQLHQLVV